MLTLVQWKPFVFSYLRSVKQCLMQSIVMSEMNGAFMVYNEQNYFQSFV